MKAHRNQVILLAEPQRLQLDCLFFFSCQRGEGSFSLIPHFSSSSDLPTGQGDKTGTMLSDGAIYSSIDFTTKASYNSPGQTSQATPYATTQILHSSSIHELAVDLPEAQWKASLQSKQEMANLGYSLPDKNSCNNSKIRGERNAVATAAFYL